MKHTTGGAAVTKMGPNNAKCVVWAISEFFFFFFSFLLLFWILTKVYSLYNGNL